MALEVYLVLGLLLFTYGCIVVVEYVHLFHMQQQP